jgi:hypothetical protein
MSFKKFLLGQKSSDLNKLKILFFRAEEAGLIPEDKQSIIYNTIEKLIITKTIGFGISAGLAYFIPIPLDIILVIPIKFFLFSFSYEVLVYRNKISAIDTFRKLRLELDLENKIEAMKLTEREKKIIEVPDE